MTEINYDVFISHAYEDKNAFTNELAYALKEKGLKVWYSGSDLKIGDSITTSVNNALKGAKYAIVVISPIYLEKQWAMNELNALFNQQADRSRILPILHNISAEQIKLKLPVIADRYAIPSEKGLAYIVSKIVEVVTGVIISKNEITKNSEPGFITLGAGSGKNAEAVKNKKTSNINKNSNDVVINNNSNKSGSTGIIIFILIILLILFFVFQNSDIFSSGAQPSNSSSPPSKPVQGSGQKDNFRNHLKPN